MSIAFFGRRVESVVCGSLEDSSVGSGAHPEILDRDLVLGTLSSTCPIHQ